jgi:phosphate transport system substrate-binding protein
MRTSLTWRGGSPIAYPITGTVFALVYQNQTDAAKAKALVNFLTWSLTTGQNFPATINYAPMGKILQQRSLGQINKIKLNGKALVKIPINFEG